MTDLDLRTEIAGHTVHRLGFGAMRIMGAKGPDGTPSRDAAVALVRRAVELGVQFLDTADIYGGGESESVIAEALRPYPDDVLIATKGGFVPGQIPPGATSLPPGGRPARLKQVCEESLRRLGVDRIELYQLHTPDPDVPYEESIGALVELRDEGKIGHIGISNVGRRHLAQAMALTPVASVQNRFNLGDRSSEKVLEACEEHGITFLPWGPIQVGGGAAALAEVADAVEATPSQVALAWLLHRSPAILPIPGTSSLAHLEENVAASDVRLTDEHLRQLSVPAA